MKFEEQKILGSYLIQHDLIEDERGIFRRSYCAKTLKKIIFILKLSKEIFLKIKKSIL